MFKSSCITMVTTLIFLHSLFRWFVLLALLSSIARGLWGYLLQKKFTKTDNALRHWTATVTHIQLLLGIILYTKSQLVSYYFSSLSTGGDPFFFGIVHISLMLVAITLVTIGSAKAKRQQDSATKFKTIVIFYLLALLFILIAIPWPFSPLAQRPLFRTF